MMPKKALLYFPFDVEKTLNRSVLAKSKSIASAIVYNGFELEEVYHRGADIIVNNKTITKGYLRLLTKIPIVKSVIGYFLPFYMSDVRADNDLIYIRHKIATPISLYLLRSIRRKNPRAKIVLEYPTYPFHSEFKGLARFYIKYIDTYFRKKNKRYADACITFGSEPEVLGLPAVNLLNGYNLDLDEMMPLTEPKPVSSDGFVITGVSGSGTNGYERIIEGLHVYKNSNIKLQLIGREDLFSSLLDLAQHYGVQDQVKLLGFLSQNEIREVLKTSDIAAGGIGAYLKGLKYCSPLKSTLFSYLGVPFFYAGIDRRFSSEEFPFALNVPNDSSPIDIENLIQFRKDISKLYPKYPMKMHEYTISKLSWNSQLKHLLDTIDL